MSQVRPIPEGYSTVTPHLIIKGAIDAIAFYKEAFGAEELHTMLCPQTGRVMHAAVKIGGSIVFLSDECPDFGSLGPDSIGGTPVTLHLYVEDVDARFQRAVDAGATVTMPLSDQFWGDRYGKVADPFGHQWSLASKVADLTPEQMHENMLKFMASFAAA